MTRYMIYIHCSGATLSELKSGNLQTSCLPHLTSAWDIPLSCGISNIIRIPTKDIILSHQFNSWGSIFMDCWNYAVLMLYFVGMFAVH